MYGDINVPEEPFAVKYDDVEFNQVYPIIQRWYLKLRIKIHIAYGTCVGWFTVDKEVFTKDTKGFKEIETLDKSETFSRKYEYKKVDQSFEIR